MAGIARASTTAPERVVATHFISKVCGKLCWHVPAQYCDMLLDNEGLRLAEWLRAGQAHVVKEGPHRTVYRVELPGLTFYLKHNRTPDWVTWIRQWLRPSKGKWEHDKAIALAARSIGTIEPLGYAEPATRFGDKESWLITRALEPTQALPDFLASTLRDVPAAEQSRLRQCLARQLGAWLAQLHAAGVRHADFHAGNVLLRYTPSPDGSPALARFEFFLVDLTPVRLGGPLGWNAGRANLLVFNHWFATRSSRSDRMRFWHAYVRGRFGPNGLTAPMRQQASALEADTWRSMLRFWRERDERCRENNRYYAPIREHGCAGHALRELDARDLDALLRDLNRPFETPDRKLLKDGPSATVLEYPMHVSGQLRTVILKRFRVQAWHDPMRSAVSHSGAMRSWILGQGFCERGLPTARPLAVFHRQRWGLPHEGYLITEKIEDAQELSDYVAGLKQVAPVERRRRMRALATELGCLLADMHRLNLSHRDLKAANILVSRDTMPLSYPGNVGTLDLLTRPRSRLWFIDLVGVERLHHLRWRRKVQNLSRLNVSFVASDLVTRTDRLRFLRAYLQWNLRGKGPWKTWWRALEQLTRRKIAKNRRSGRPLT